MPVRMYSIISRACAYACAGTQARKAKKHSLRMSKITCLTTKKFHDHGRNKRNRLHK